MQARVVEPWTVAATVRFRPRRRQQQTTAAATATPRTNEMTTTMTKTTAIVILVVTMTMNIDGFAFKTVEILERPSAFLGERNDDKEAKLHSAGDVVLMNGEV